MPGWKHTQASYNADIVESDLLAIFDSGGELIIMLLKSKPIPHSWRSRSAVASCACLHKVQHKIPAYLTQMQKMADPFLALNVCFNKT